MRYRLLPGTLTFVVNDNGISRFQANEDLLIPTPGASSLHKGDFVQSLRCGEYCSGHPVSRIGDAIDDGR